MTKKEAILKAKEIIEFEDFELETYAISEKDMKNEDISNWHEVGDKVFKLVDSQGCNLGGIESRIYDTLGAVLDDMDIYHDDYVFPCEEGEGVPEYARFLCDDEATGLLMVSSPDDYEQAIA